MHTKTRADTVTGCTIQDAFSFLCVILGNCEAPCDIKQEPRVGYSTVNLDPQVLESFNYLQDKKIRCPGLPKTVHFIPVILIQLKILLRGF